MLNQTLNIHIQKHLVEGSSIVRKHSIFLFLMHTAIISVSFDMSSISLKTELHPFLHFCHISFK